MKSTIRPAVMLDGAFLSCMGPLDSERKCGVLEQTHELWVFLDFIHRPHSSSFMRRSEFSPRRWEDFLWVNPYLRTEQSGCPALPSLQPSLTLRPEPHPHSLFIVCPPLSHIWTARVRYPENMAPAVAATYFQLPNQKQTAITRAPSSSSSQASSFINPCPCDACFPPGHFIPAEGRWCKTAASQAEDLATPNTIALKFSGSGTTPQPLHTIGFYTALTPLLHRKPTY